MREILFRGKRIDNGEWVEGSLFNAKEDMFIIPHGNKYRYDELEGLAFDVYGCKVNPSTVGQYTGLVDKNGVKIFEGDLIRSTETGETAIVQWFSEHSAFMIWCKTSNQVGFLYECEKSIIEIIGNIHDNPELMGGGNP